MIRFFEEIVRPELPAVDFSPRTVAAVFAGQKPSGGYSVKITQIIKKESGLIADFVLEEPPEDAMVITVITTPCHIVTFPRAEESLLFRREGKTPPRQPMSGSFRKPGTIEGISNEH
jgi:hypothetical protein